MGGYNVKILEIFAIGTFLYLGWISLFLGYRKKLDYMRFEQASKNSSNLIQMVNGMQDIKLNNCENQKRWKWEKIQVKLFNISFKELRLVQYQQLGLAKTEHSHPLGMVVSTHFRCGKGVKRGLKNGALPFNID